VPRTSGPDRQLTIRLIEAITRADGYTLFRLKRLELIRTLRKDVRILMSNTGRMLIHPALRRTEAARLVEEYLRIRGDAPMAPYEAILAGRMYAELLEAASQALLEYAESMPETVMPPAPPPPGLAPTPNRTAAVSGEPPAPRAPSPKGEYSRRNKPSPRANKPNAG